MMLNSRLINSMTSVKAYPGADISSDHNPIVGSVRLRLKKTDQRKTYTEIKE